MMIIIMLIIIIIIMLIMIIIIMLISLTANYTTQPARLALYRRNYRNTRPK